MMQKIRWGLLITLVIVSLAIILQNSTPIALKLFWFEGQLPTSTLLLVISGVSFLGGALTTRSMLSGKRKTRETAPEPTAPPETPHTGSGKLFTPHATTAATSTDA